MKVEKMRNDDKLSELGVQDGDKIVMVSDVGPISSISPNALGLNPDGSVLNCSAALQVLQHDFNQCQTDLMESEVRVGEAGVSRPSLEENDITSQVHEESYSKQESVWGNNDMSEKVNIQSNGTSTHVEEFDGDCGNKLNAGVKELSGTSIQVVGSSDLSDSDNFTSSENVNADMLAKYSKETEVGNSELLDSSLSPSMVSPHSKNPLPTPTKGYVPKKWRRIRREIAKDASPSLDSTKMLKRGSANSLDAKQPNEGSALSTNAFVKSVGDADQSSHPIQNSNNILTVDATFSVGADDGDDRSSKSSTAASAPKHRHGLLSGAGYHQREKHRVKNLSGRQLNSSGQRLQTGKGQLVDDTSKKARGGNMEKVNSLSSMESNSRSYGSVLVRHTGSENSDQLQSERLANFDGEDSCNQQVCEVQSAEELQAGHSRNGDLSPDCSAEFSCNNNRRSSKDQLSRECEPLANSILMLQSAQEALEREAQLFKELGKGIHSLCDDSGKTNGGSTYAMFSTPEACTGFCPDSLGLESNHVYLRKNVNTLEMQLDEAKVRLREKDLRVVELEISINSMESHQADVRSMMELQHKRCQDMEAKLEFLFKQNVEAEVQSIVMTKSAKDLSALVEDQSKLLWKHNSETRKQAQLLRVVANKTAVLQGQAIPDNSKTNIVGEEILKIQKRIVKSTSCLFIQLSLLVVIFRLLMLQLSPESATVVPT